MADEIIVNDGGAPSRIIPFIANETIAAGDYVKLHTNGQIMPARASGNIGLGVSLTAATSGNVVNCVTGKGVLLKTFVSGALNPGAKLWCIGTEMCLAHATGDLAKWHVVATFAETEAYAGSGVAPALKKVFF